MFGWVLLGGILIITLIRVIKAVNTPMTDKDVYRLNDRIIRRERYYRGEGNVLFRGR